MDDVAGQPDETAQEQIDAFSDDLSNTASDAHAKPRLGEVQTQMRDLLRIEDQSLYAQGDLLLRARLSETELAGLARYLQRSKATLKQRMAVAEEFKGKVRHRYAWSIASELMRLDSHFERMQVLYPEGEDNPPEWTTDTIRTAVNRRLKDKAIAAGRITEDEAITIFRGGFRLGTDKDYVRVTGTLKGQNIEIRIEPKHGAPEEDAVKEPYITNDAIIIAARLP